MSSFLRAVEAVLKTPKFLLSPNPADYYDYLGDDVIEGQHAGFVDPAKPLWLNLGYWKTARTYPEAAAGMATKVAEAGRFGPTDDLLDVGFGFAEQDVFWVEKFGVKKIVGLNITPSQVERAQARMKERGLADRIDLRLGSATEIPFEPNSFDKVSALECAHHFDTRERFFEEAFRVLRPGGVLVTADGVSSAEDPPIGFVQKMSLKRWCVPLPNVYHRGEYVKRLEAKGFVNVKAESIRNYVFPGVLKYHGLRNSGVSMTDARIELSQEEMDRCAGIELFKLTGLTDYVIFSAEKPR